VLAHTLDSLLRLLHPLVPFVTEEIWQLLATAAPDRGMEKPSPAAASVMIAAWPAVEERRIDAQIEARFARFQEVLGGLREIRSRRNIPPKSPIRFSVRSDAATVELLRPMEPYFKSMAGAESTAWGADVQPPTAAASFGAQGLEVFVDLAEFIDVAAEVIGAEKEIARLEGAIANKQKQLSNQNFVSRAPAAVIDKERAALAQLEQELQAMRARLAALRQNQP
jgi:valyl-tRNA synthetase